MIRLLGAITGSALAIATLLLVVGIPQFSTEDSPSEHAIVRLPLPTSPVDQGGQPVAAPDTGTGEKREVSPGEPGSRDSGSGGERGTPAAEDPQGLLATIDDARTAVRDGPLADEPGEAPPVLDTPQSWYAFWSPFRSELAARGFVAQLQSVTGLDYRVVRVKPGVYEVAFAYEDDDDIAANLTQITAATGLELEQ